MKPQANPDSSILNAQCLVNVRFHEVDSMGITWHGAYVQFFEDAREAFGNKYGLDYLTIFDQGYYTPLVSMHYEFKHPLVYGDQARVEITFRNTNAAKIIFDYQVFNTKTNVLSTVGSTTQVFLNKAYELQLFLPPFYQTWKMKQGLLVAP